MYNITFYNSSGAKLNKFDFSTTTNCSGLCYNNTAITGDFEVNLPNVNDGSYCFNGCTNITSFTSNLQNLVIGTYMNSGCSKMVSYKAQLGNLRNGSYMFNECTVLANFETESLESLEDSTYMFQSCKALTSFEYNMPSLKNGTYMFNACTALEKFISSTDSLETGTNMFSGCTALTTFVGSLSSLVTASNMFNNCKLDETSVLYIMESIPNRTGLTKNALTLGINCFNTEEDKQVFASNLGFNTWADFNKYIATDKNWNVAYQYNRPTEAAANVLSLFSSTYPIYFKLIEVENPDAGFELISEDGEKHYNCEWFHEANDTEGFEYFGSFLEAFGYHGIIPKEYYES